MKKFYLALISAGILLLSTSCLADTSAPTVPASNDVQTFQVLALDMNGDEQINEKEVQTGQDKFLARPATLAEIAQPAHGLFIGEDNNYYVPAAVQDLQMNDVDKNNALSAAEANNAKIKLITDQGTTAGKQFLITTFADNGIGMIRLVNDGSAIKVKLIPTIGSAPIKVYNVEMDKF